jgi:hypothetical protein
MTKFVQEAFNYSAEQLAIERLKDVDDPDKWETVIEVDDEIDVEASLEHLKQRGYKIKIPSQSK